jgi:chemotaxis protein MotB
VPNNKEARQPIIIKRVKKHGHGHHGGAWKIAYADFVTAMMAFFLLMWLLGSTTKGDLQGISDYFRMPLKVALTGGSGAGETQSVIQGGSRGLTPINSEVQNSTQAFQRLDRSKKKGDGRAEEEAQEKRRLAQLKEKVEEILLRSPNLDRYQDQIRLDLMSEGLRIQIVDAQSRPMFDLGSSVVKDYMRQILREIGAVLNTVDHKVTLSGHTDAKQYSSGERGYSNWELSSDRANASRRELIAGGMDETKILRVVGVGSSVMLNKADPNDPVNRRISIIVMNKQTERKVLRDMGSVDVRDAEDVEQELKDPAATNDQAATQADAGKPAKPQ